MSAKCWVLSIANHKGGVGKTSTSLNLACAFALTKRKVLLIDMDPQGSATVSLLKDRPSSVVSLGNALLSGTSLVPCIQEQKHVNFDFIPASDDLTAFSVHMQSEQSGLGINIEHKEHCLKHALAPLRKIYDLIIIDCPPSLNLITANALCASDELIVPCTCEYYAVAGLGSLLAYFESLKQSYLSNVHCMGIVRTMYDRDHSLSQKISENLSESFGDLMFKTVIPLTYRISESPSIGLPVIAYDRSSLGSKAYMSLAGEIVKRLKARYYRAAASAT